MSEVKYILLTTVKKEAKNAEWWERQTKDTEEIQTFGTFEKAKEAMITVVKTLTKKCRFFPYKRGKYLPYEEYWQDCEEYIGEDPQAVLFRKVLSAVLSDPGTDIEGVDELDYQDADDADWYFAFAGGKNIIHVYNDGRLLETNMHRMADDSQTYYFNYTEENEDGMVINGISVRLLNTAKKKETTSQKKSKNQPKQEKAPEYEVMTLGSFVQDKEGKVKSPLTWRVLGKKDGKALLITERVIDYRRFSVRHPANWETSDIRKWLNSDFLEGAFNEKEKSLIQNNDSGDKVFLLSVEEFYQYFPNIKDSRAGYTEYTRKKKSDHREINIRDLYGFWWLRTVNKDEPKYLYHACSDGTLNCYMYTVSYDGVRPAMWVKL